MMQDVGITEHKILFMRLYRPRRSSAT